MKIGVNSENELREFWLGITSHLMYRPSQNEHNKAR